MKRYMIWSGAALMLVLAVAGVVVARAADGRGPHGWHGRRWGYRGPIGYISHELQLSDAQRAQISTMWQAERPQIASLVRELISEGKEMDAARAQGNPDEGTVQAIASREGGTIAKLFVEKEVFTSKIYASVLNPDQRTRADSLERRWHSKLDGIADHLERGGGKD